MGRPTTKHKSDIVNIETSEGEYCIKILDKLSDKEKPQIKLLKWRRRNGKPNKKNST